MIVRNATTELVVGARVEPRSTWWGRARGLLGRRNVAAGEGIALTPCAAVHTLFMRTALDLVFTDDAGIVVAVHHNVAPGRAVVAARGATTVVELGPGSLAHAPVHAGDRLVFDL